MPQNYVPIFIFVALIGVLIPVTLFAANKVTGMRTPISATKMKIGT